jgi:hypothetical protein
MSANYTITVTDSLGAIATINLFIDLKAKVDGVLIYNPIYRDNGFLKDASTFFDEVIEFERLVSRDQSISNDLLTELLITRDQSIFTDTITGGGGGS